MSPFIHDKLKNDQGSSFPLMTIKASITYLLHALMMKRNGQSNVTYLLT